MDTKVKICGITSLEDAQAAVAAGADLLGFNFYPPSPRYIRPEDCARIVSVLKETSRPVITTGVFVNSPAQHIQAILDQCGLDLAQLSGDEPPEILATLGERAFKGLRFRDPAGLALAVRQYPPRPYPPAWLIDAYRPGAYGGTGQTADWSLARRLAGQAPVLLAGGLRPENVTDALRQVDPWGVDVASGVEDSPGRKSSVMMSAFISTVRLYSQTGPVTS
jgi:phosphoribosylanthranilate isomerase